MPAAIVAGGAIALVVLLYFYFAQYIVQDVNYRLDSVKPPISGFPVVGPFLVSLISIVQGQLWNLRGIFIAQQQGAVNWASSQVAWMIRAVVDLSYGSDLWNYSIWTRREADSAVFSITTWISDNINAQWASITNLWNRANDAFNIAFNASQAINGWIAYNINQLNINVGTLFAIAIDAQNLGRQAIHDLATWVPGRLDNLERWKEQEQTQVLPRIQADVNTRARTIDVDALQQRVIALEHAVTLLLALGIIAGEGAQAIENLRCISKVDCGTLSGLADCDVCDRLNALEIAV